jgi:methionine-rich copper-binding protein CopC
MKRTLVVMVALLAMVAFASGVMAQAPVKTEKPAAPAVEKAAPAPAQPKPAAEKPKTEKPKALKFSGAVAGYEAGKMIKVKAKDKEMTFDVTGDTKMKGEAKEGAKVTVNYKKDGAKMVATSITVSAEKKPPATKPPEKAAEKAPEKAPEKK